MSSASKADHRQNRLLAALGPEDLAYLEPHLEIVRLPKGAILYEAGDIIHYTYFPHNTFVTCSTLWRRASSSRWGPSGARDCLA